jgi:hypothetical protein
MKTNQIVCTVTILANLLGAFGINIESVRANPQQCYNEAIPYGANSYTANQVAWMCQGTESTIPAECFKLALPYRHTDLVVKRLAMLCKAAKSTEPGKCFQAALEYSYTDESVERVYTLCKTPEPSRDDRGESDRHRNDRQEPRGAWQVKMNGWTGLLRMYGDKGTLILVFTKNGEIIEEKMELEKSDKYGYVLNGTVINATNKKASADNLFISQFLKETIEIKGCDVKTCYDMTLTYLGE